MGKLVIFCHRFFGEIASELFLCYVCLLWSFLVNKANFGSRHLKTKKILQFDFEIQYPTTLCSAKFKMSSCYTVHCTWILSSFHFNVYFVIMLNNIIIVPTPLEGMGEELYTQMGFLFSQFWPIDIFIVQSWD